MKMGLTGLLMAALALGICLAGGYPVQAQRPEARENASESPQSKGSLWMKHKLAASQTILEGMTRADFEMIDQSATGLDVMSYLEGWARADKPGYKEQLNAFDHATNALILAARDKNLDGVTIAYTQLAISCVQCHKLVRDRVTQ